MLCGGDVEVALDTSATSPTPLLVFFVYIFLPRWEKMYEKLQMSTLSTKPLHVFTRQTIRRTGFFRAKRSTSDSFLSQRNQQLKHHM
jgi:hypothetical protein